MAQPSEALSQLSLHHAQSNFVLGLGSGKSGERGLFE